METLYAREHYATKKALSTAVKDGKKVEVYSASVFGTGKAPDGKHTLCGPGEYDRKYYAQITVSNGAIVTIK